MDIFRIAALGVVGAVLAVMLQQQRKEIALVLTISVSALILLESSGWLEDLLTGLGQIADQTGLSGGHLKLLMKLLAVSYVTEYGSEICKDAGQQSLAMKVQLGGKLLMASLTLPVFETLLESIAELLV